MNYEKMYYQRNKKGSLLVPCYYERGSGSQKIGSAGCIRCKYHIAIDKVHQIVMCDYFYHNKNNPGMKDLKQIINEIDVDAIEKALHILSGIKNIKNKAVEKEPEKSIEEQVFELAKSNAPIYMACKYFLNLETFEKNIKNSINIDPHNLFLFLLIMKGVHKLIEGDNFDKKNYNHDIIAYYPESEEYYIENITEDECRYLPEFFEFTLGNGQKALQMLSNFFGINILDWFYRS